MPPLPIRRILDSLGMFSPAREALEKISQKTGTGESFRAQLLKHGASEEELDYLDLDDTLKRETLTKDQLTYRLEQADTEPIEEVYYRSKLEPIGVSIENWKEMTPREFSIMRSDDFKDSVVGTMQRNTENFIAKAQGNEASLAEVMDRLDPRDIHPEHTLERPTLTSEIETELTPMSKYQEATAEDFTAELKYNFIPDHFDYQHIDGQVDDIARGIPITPISKSSDQPPRIREQQAIANMGYKDIFGGRNGIGWAQALVRIHDKSKQLTLMVDDLHHAEEYMTDEVIRRANTFLETKGQRPLGSDPLPNEEQIEAFGESNRNKEAFKRLDAEYDLKEEMAEIEVIDLEMSERYEGYIEREVGEVQYLREWEARVEKLITRRTSGPAKAIMNLAYDLDSDLKAFVDDGLPELADRATSYFHSVADSHPNKYFIGDVKIDGFARLAKDARLEVANDDRGVFFRVTDPDSGWWKVPAGAKDDLPYNAYDGHFIPGMRPITKFNKWMDLGLYQNPKEFMEAFRPPMKARAFADRYRRVQAPYTDSLFYNRLLELRPESAYFELTPPGTDETTYDMLVWNMRSSKHGDFRESHVFSGTPKAQAVKNTLGWMRFDIKHLNGEKVMFINELQSDWVQKAVKRGAYTSAERRGLEGLFAKAAARGGVPKQPFIKPDKFYAFAFKRALQHAVEKDVDRIAWTTGHMQKNIYPKKNEVVINPDLYHNLYTKYLTEGRYNKGMFMNLQEEILAQGESTRFPNWGAKEYEKLGYKPEEPVHGFDEDGYPQLEGPSFRRFGFHTQYDIGMPNVMNRLMRKYTPKDPNAPRKNHIEPLDIHPQMTTDYEWPRTKKYKTEFSDYERVELGREAEEMSLDEEAASRHFNGVTNYTGRDEKLGSWDHVYYFHDQTVVPSVKIPLELRAEIKSQGLRRFGFVQGGLLRSINREAFVAGSLVKAAKALGRLGKKTEPIKTYHGSPHKVDKFSSEHIGTGEGHQGFGYGLYFAELEHVAENYRMIGENIPAGDHNIMFAMKAVDHKAADENRMVEGFTKLPDAERTEKIALKLESMAQGEANIGRDMDEEMFGIAARPGTRELAGQAIAIKHTDPFAQKMIDYITSPKNEKAPMIPEEAKKLNEAVNTTIKQMSRAEKSSLIGNYTPGASHMQESFELYLKWRRDNYRNLIKGAEKIRGGYDPTGKLYEVNLAVKDSQLLDWDLPMGEQHPTVKRKARKVLKEVGDWDDVIGRLRAVTAMESKNMQRLSKIMDKITLGPMTSKLFNELSVPDFLQIIEGPLALGRTRVEKKIRRAAGSDKLSDAGIKGLKYYDGISRRRQSGSRNYVIFDPKVIEISKMYGVSIPLAAMLLDQDNGL